MDDADVGGGTLDDVTVGLNWYLIPNSRFMFDYVFAHRATGGRTRLFVARFHVDF